MLELFFSFYSEEFSLTNAAFAIIRGGVTPADLATVQLHNGEQVYMSLLSCWGYAADIDIESEVLRVIGEARFLVGAVKTIIQKKTYSGKLHYLPVEEEEISNGAEHEGRTEQENAQHRKKIVKEDTTSDTQNGTISKSSKPSTELLPSSFTDAVPNNWKTVEGNFIAFSSFLQPFLGHGFIGGNIDLTMGSGTMQLTYILDDATRKDMFDVIYTADTGLYLQKGFAHNVKTRAYRLEMFTSPGHLTVDGEEVEYGSHQVQVLPQMIHVMSRKRRNESK